MLVLLVSLTLPYSLEHSLGLAHLRLLLLHPLTHSGVGILRIVVHPQPPLFVVSTPHNCPNGRLDPRTQAH